MKAFDKASLALVPDGVKDGKLYSIKPTDGSGDFTFTRGSNLAATRVDENGLIEKGRENMIVYSNKFDESNWNKYNGASVSSTRVEGPFGEINAWELTFGTGNDSRIEQQLTTVNGNIYNFSVWARVTSGTKNVRLGGVGSLVTKTLTTTWQRIENYAVETDTNAFPQLRKDNAEGEYTIQIYGFQFEQGLAATDYIETGATTAQAGILEDLPRIDYTGGTPSLLMEPSRTNIMPQSEALDEYSEFKVTGSETTISYTQSVTPEGLNATTQRFLETASTSKHRIYFDNISGVSTGSDYTFSFFVKSIGGRNITTSDGGKGIEFTVSVDLSNGEIQYDEFDNGTVVSYGNGWYRIIVSGTNNSGLNLQRVFIGSIDGSAETFLGDTSKGLLLWGVQLEEGLYSTSYIPTYGASATRSYDYYSNTSLSNIGSTDRCTFYCEIDLPQGREGSAYFFRFDGPASSFAWKGNYVPSPIISIIGTGNINNSGTITVSTGVHKLIVRWENGVGSIFIDGAKKTEQVTISATEVFDEFSSQGAGYRHLQKSALVFPEVLSDAECIRLTTKNLTLTKPAFVGGAGLNNFVVAVSGDIAGGSGTIETNWQWQISNDGNTWADVNGATNDYYTIPNNTNLLGKYIRVEQSINDEYGTLTVVASDGQQILQLAGLFDSVPGTAGYSLNRLRSQTPSGAAARVTRDGTDFASIGFTSNNLFDSAAAMAYATQTGNIAQYFFDEEFDINTFFRYGGEIDALVTPFRGEENVLVYEVANDAIDAKRHFAKTVFDPTLGHTIRVQAKVLLPSNQKVDKVRIWTGFPTDGYIDVTTTDVWVDVDQTLVVSSGTNIEVQAYFDTNDRFYAPGDKFYIKDLTITDTTPNLHVQTLYDQSGNNNHAVQNAFQSMPKIIEDGVLVEENGKPAIKFDGVDDGYVLSDQDLITSLTDGTHMAISVHSVDDVSVGATNLIYSVVDRNNSARNYFALGYRSNEARAGYYNGSSWSAKDIAASNNTQYLGSNVVVSGVPDFYQNSNQAVSGNEPGLDGQQGLSIGKGTNNNFDLTGKIQEVIFFNSDQSKIREGIERVIANRYNIDLS